jgi:glyoxylase-like metal-dependent hydrolase (beta-lactamase superfamily II)
MKNLIITFSLLFATVLAAEDANIDFKTTKVADGLYMLSGVNGFTGGNIGLSVGDDGVIMIDDSMPPLLDKLKAAINKVSGKPVSFLLNTHVHGDHTGNNAAFGDAGTHIVAHENLRQHLLTKGVRGKPAVVESLPVITFSHSMNFYLNGQHAHLLHVAHAHTDGDAVIHYPELNVIHTGDVFFNGMFPFIDLKSGGSVDGYIKAQQKILALADVNTKIIPGHGPLASKAELQQANQMLIAARDAVKKLVDAGKSEEEIVAENPLARFDKQWSWQFITTERMTRQLVKGLSQ